MHILRFAVSGTISLNRIADPPWIEPKETRLAVRFHVTTLLASVFCLTQLCSMNHCMYSYKSVREKRRPKFRQLESVAQSCSVSNIKERLSQRSRTLHVHQQLWFPKSQACCVTWSPACWIFFCYCFLWLTLLVLSSSPLNVLLGPSPSPPSSFQVRALYSTINHKCFSHNNKRLVAMQRPCSCSCVSECPAFRTIKAWQCWIWRSETK